MYIEPVLLLHINTTTRWILWYQRSRSDKEIAYRPAIVLESFPEEHHLHVSPRGDLRRNHLLGALHSPYLPAPSPTLNLGHCFPTLISITISTIIFDEILGGAVEALVISYVLHSGCISVGTVLRPRPLTHPCRQTSP